MDIGEDSDYEDDNENIRTSIKLPDIIRTHLDDWDSISPIVALEVKKAFVHLLPELGPAETLMMLIMKDPESETPYDDPLGYIVEIVNRPIRGLLIPTEKTEIWLIKRNLTFNPHRSSLHISRDDPVDIDDLYGCEDIISCIPHLIISINHTGSNGEDMAILVKLCQIYKVRTLEVRENTPRCRYYNRPLDWFGIKLAPREIPFARDLCRLISPNINDFRNFMLTNTAIREVEIIHHNRWGYSSFNPAIHATQCLRSLEIRTLRHNFYLRRFDNVNVDRQKIVPSASTKEKRALDKIVKRNEDIFLQKYGATLILLGISKFRKLPAALCRDIMKVIAQTVFYTHPLAAHLIQIKAAAKKADSL